MKTIILSLLLIYFSVYPDLFIENLFTLNQKSEINYSSQNYDATTPEPFNLNKFKKYIPEGYKIEQAISNDFDIDGIDDVLMIISPEKNTQNDKYTIDYLPLLLFKGYKDETYKLIKRNDNTIDYDVFIEENEGTICSDKKGEFKIQISGLRAKWYETYYLFKYNEEKNNWYLDEYYSTVQGEYPYNICHISTSLNFGEVSFDDFRSDMNNYMYSLDENSIAIDEYNFKLDASYVKINLYNKEKQEKINALITEDINKLIEILKAQKIPINIRLHTEVMFQNPDIISLRYYISGTIDNNKLGSTFFSTNIDINSEKRITLSDIIEPYKLAEIVKKVDFKIYDDNNYSNQIENYGIDFSESVDELESLFTDFDKIENVFDKNNKHVYILIFEKFLCICLKPELSYYESTKGDYIDEYGTLKYISKDEIKDYLKINLWEYESKAAINQ